MLSLVSEIQNNPAVRKELARKSHIHFFHIYLSRHVKYETANFQREMFAITEDPKINRAVIVAFRGSAKSTIMSLSYPIWATLGKAQKKFIVVISMTQEQARLILSNIKDELLNNSLLNRDFGPFTASDFEWNADSIVIPKYGTRLTALSANQSIRGIRHNEHRPDLVICDDIEDMPSVKTRESREKTYRWFNGDVLPLGDKDTKIIVIGNLLHEDSLIMKQKRHALRHTGSWAVKAYSLLDDQGVIAWPGKYPDKHAVDLERKQTDRISWMREYLLKIVPDNDVVVHPDWIRYYSDLPVTDNDMRLLREVTSIDLAISDKASADCTAMVQARIYQIQNEIVTYILPHPINQRLDFPSTVERIQHIYEDYNCRHTTFKIYVEETSYQKSIVQHLESMGISVQGVSVNGTDKRSRLSFTAPKIKNGSILFPKEGADALINQIVGFGVEAHDDLADAFTMLVQETANDQPQKHVEYEIINALFDFNDDPCRPRYDEETDTYVFEN